MEPEEPENRQENPAGTGPIEHRLIEEKEPSGQTPQRVPDDIRENESGKPDGTGEAGIVREQEEELIGHDVMKAPDEVLKTVKAVTPAAVTRKENRSKVSKHTTPIIPPPVNEVKRKTELQGMSTKSSPGGPTRVRKRTERDLKDPKFGIPYVKTEKAVRDLVCSLMERQDRMNTDIFLEINSMNEDIAMLKDQVYKIRITKSGTAAGAKK
jgi:adenylosuccinate synthase